jgi:hypothetical protein
VGAAFSHGEFPVAVPGMTLASPAEIGTAFVMPVVVVAVVGAGAAAGAPLEQPAASKAMTAIPPTTPPIADMGLRVVRIVDSPRGCVPGILQAVRTRVPEAEEYAAAVHNFPRNLFVFVLAAALLVAGCGSSAKPGASSTTATTVPGGHVAIPVSANPSISAKMICEEDVRDEVFDIVGLKPSQPLQPTWKDHVYSCKYVYPNGAMTLSVKELADKDQTDAYFASLATSLGKTKDIKFLGQGAFATKSGSVVVRKDYKVLTVDVSKVPAEFGTPPDKRSNVAINIGSEIMNCWTGA